MGSICQLWKGAVYTQSIMVLSKIT